MFQVDLAQQKPPPVVVVEVVVIVVVVLVGVVLAVVLGLRIIVSVAKKCYIFLWGLLMTTMLTKLRKLKTDMYLYRVSLFK